MKLCFKIYLIFGFYIVTNYGQRVSLIGSYFVPNDHTNYKAVLLTNQLNSPNIQVALSSAGSPDTLKNFNGPVNNVELKPPRLGDNGYELKVTTGNCKSQPIKLSTASDRSIMFINFAAPVYKTGEFFKFQIFVLDQNLKPRQNFRDFTATIYDSEGHIIKYYNDMETSNHGDYEMLFKIADSPNLGKWTIQVDGFGRKITKTFYVLKPDSNGMELFVDVPSMVAFEDKKIFMNIYVKDKFDKLFAGTANIKASAWFKGSTRLETNKNLQTVNITGSKISVVLDIQDDLALRYPSKDMIIRFDVEVTNSITQNSIKVSKETEMRHKGKHVFDIVRKKFFKPGFKFPVKIRVNHINGSPDNSFNQLSLTVKYAASKTKIVEKSFQIDLRNGETVANIQPAADTKQIQLTLQFAGTEQTEKIDRFPTFGANEYMQVSMVTKNPSVGKQVQFQAYTSGEMEALHVLVIGTFGIVYNKEFKDAVQKDIFNFSIPFTEEMRPEARGIAFYVRPSDGVIVFDEFSLNPGVSVENSLEITTASENIKPGDSVNLNVKTEHGSKVFLTAVDHNPISVIRSNEISRSDIYNELVHYLNLKFPSTSRYHLEKLNGFVFEAMTNGQCNKNITNFEAVEVENSKSYNWSGNYFPETWINEIHELNQNTMEIKKDAPESYTSWRVFGVSVHPQKGFTIAKVQPKILVKNDISAQIKAPTSAFDTEVFVVELNAFNFLKVDLKNVLIEVKIDGADGVKTSKQKGNINCIDFSPNGKILKQSRKNLPAETMTNLDQFLIQADKSGDIKVTVRISAENYVDKVTKVIKILKSDRISKTIYQNSLITVDGNKRTADIDGPNKTEGDGYATVYGNLLGPALGGLETIFDKPLTTDEERVLKFAAAIINYKFMNSIQHNNDPRAKKAYDDIETGYQEAVALIDKILREQDEKSFWLAAIVVQVILDASEIVHIDQNLITKALDFIKSQQQSDGSFKYDKDSDYHRDIGSKFRKDIQTALIIPAFFKTNQFKSKYSTEIQKTMNYLKSQNGWGDYIKVVAAYTFALNNDKEDAKKLLESMKNIFNNTDNAAHYSLSVEIASYKILTNILTGNDDLQKSIDWLLSHRNADGSFYSPYDTVLALKALYEYSNFKKLHSQNINLQLTLNRRAVGNSIKNPLNFETVEIKNKNQKLTIAGQGTTYVSVYDEIIENQINIVENFDAHLTKKEFPNNKVEMYLSIIAQKTTNLVAIEVELPRGYKYNPEGHVNSTEIHQTHTDYDHNRVIFYIKKLEQGMEFTLTIEATKIFEFRKHKSSMIKVYDYYRSNLKDTIYYSFDKNQENCDQGEKVNDLETLDREMEIVKSKELEANELVSNLSKYDDQITKIKAGIEKAFKTIEGANTEKISANDVNQETINSTKTTLDNVDELLNNLNAPIDIDDQIEEEPHNNGDDLNFQDSTQINIELQKLAEEAKQTKQNINKAKAEETNSKKTINKVMNKLEKIKENSNAIKSKADELENKLNGFQDLNTARSSLTNLENRLKNPDENIKAYLSEVKITSSYLDDVKKQIDDTKRDSSTMKLSNLKENVISIQNEINLISQELTNERNKIASLSFKNLQANSTLNKVNLIETNIKKFHNDADALKGEAKTEEYNLQLISQNDINHARKAHKDALQELKKLNQEKQNIDGKIAKLTQKYPNAPKLERNRQVVTSTTPQPDDSESTLETTTRAHQTRPVAQSEKTKNQANQNGNDPNCMKWYRFCNFGL